MEKRDFNDVAERIYSVGNKVLNKHLMDLATWPATVRWHRLRGYVKLYVPQDYKDWTCVRIYAAMWGCSLKEARRRLKQKSK